MIKTSEAVRCDLCLGSGRFTNPYHSSSYAGYQPCPKCEGRGKIIRYNSNEVKEPARLMKEESLVINKPKENPKPIKLEYSLNNLDFKKLLIYSFLGLAGKAILDRSKKEQKNVREIRS